jgi:hypothetical protein
VRVGARGVSKFCRVRTCSRPAGRASASKLHSRSASRHRTLDGLERPVCLLLGRIQAAKPAPMTQRSEQRRQRSAVALFLSLLLDVLARPAGRLRESQWRKSLTSFRRRDQWDGPGSAAHRFALRPGHVSSRLAALTARPRLPPCATPGGRFRAPAGRRASVPR